MSKIEALIAQQTTDFVKLCRKYIDYIDNLPDKKVTEFWTTQLNLLSGIYNQIFLLPKIDARYEAYVEKFVTEQEYNKLFRKLEGYVGSLDKFPDFTNLSHPGSFQVIETSLSETLTDIYQEVKDFVLLYETGTIENMNDAIADCVDSFGEYWGVKLLAALRIMHINLYQNRYAEAKKEAQTIDDEIEKEMLANSEFGEEGDE